MRLLLIEADRGVAASIDLMLRAGGAYVEATDDGEEGADLARIYGYDLILLSLDQLNDGSGFDVLRALRVGKIKTPVVALTRDTRPETRVKAISGGADDCLSVPFYRDELVARIHAVIRRSAGFAGSEIDVGDVSLSLASKLVSVAGVPLRVTGKEYQMLELLALRPRSTITKEMFLNGIYGGRDEPELKIIDVFICKLRKKLRAAGARTAIETVWGRGYRLMPAAELEAAE